MSIARPQNRDEFRQYVLTKLGAPVLEVNVAEEQIDIAIEDAFQYFNERSHFLGTERMYLTTRLSPEFITAFKSFKTEYVPQGGSVNAKTPIPGRPTESAAGMVSELTLVSPGEGYPPNAQPQNIINTGQVNNKELEIDTESSLNIQTQLGDNIVYSTGGNATNGTGLTVSIGPQRTTKNGITTVYIYDTGSGYEVGDIVTIQGSASSSALFEVSKVKTESPVFGHAAINTQNNYLVLPDNVVSVTEVMKSQGTDVLGIFPGGSIFPLMLGGMLGNDQACGDQGYNLVSYVAMQEYMATMQFLFFPPTQYNFNERTHRLFIDTNNFSNASGSTGDTSNRILCLECMVKPSPDVYPDLWNDLFVKEYATALVKAQWGRNLTKYNSVNLPGGISMNGAQILADARQDIATIKDRFGLDYADPVLDLVG
jgi:hypothetical protein